jgi:hypothetical protein
MTGHRFSILIGMSAITLFGFAERALADAGGLDAAISLPIARVFLGLASVAFTALLVRGTTR